MAKVLLVEDDLTKGANIKAALEAKGHEVVWILGIVRGSRQSFETHTPEGGTGVIQLADFQIALVDGILKGHHSDGKKLIRPLLQNNIVCIGISGEGEHNPGLIAAGAASGIPKEDVVGALAAGTLDLDALCS